MGIPQAVPATPVNVPPQPQILHGPTINPPGASASGAQDNKEEESQKSLDDLFGKETAVPESERQVGEVDVSLTEDDENDPTPLLTCPHCWHVFHQSKILYISQHPELTGDPVLGPSTQLRFLPTNYNSDGIPLDAMGLPCTDLACPKCHLQIPDVMLDHQNDLFSIVGCPSAGKSYYLTALISQMRTSLTNFNYSVTDADTTLNLVLSNYEQMLFLNSDAQKAVALPKTELQGNDFSSQVILDGFSVNLPLPFVFTIRAIEQQNSELTERNLVFYDNAGEHFEPGRDQVANRATRHLVKSECVIFLLDPFKDLRLRKICQQDDPQAGKLKRDVNQMQILNEMIGRMRKNSGLTRNQKYSRPLMMVVSKFDGLLNQFPLNVKETDYTLMNADGTMALNISYIKLVSWLLRTWLMSQIPDLVPTCESFFERVYYLPASALGTQPFIDETSGMLCVHPGDIKPFWCDVPLLVRMWENGLLPGVNIQVDATTKPADEYCTSDDGMMKFQPPGMKHAMLVPRLYWGAEVHDEKLGFIRFPNPHYNDKDQAKAEVPIDTEVEDDFWK